MNTVLQVISAVAALTSVGLGLWLGVKWAPPGSRYNGRPVVLGMALAALGLLATGAWLGLVEGWQDWLIPWESYVITVDEFVDAGDKVVTLVRIRGRTSRDGVEVEHRPAAVWTVGDGQVTAVTFFLDRDEAFEFAGIGG